jgi:hypothetical protein
MEEGAKRGMAREERGLNEREVRGLEGAESYMMNKALRERAVPTGGIIVKRRDDVGVMVKRVNTKKSRNAASFVAHHPTHGHLSDGNRF